MRKFLLLLTILCFVFLGVNSSFAVLKAYDYEQITVSSTAVGLTTSKIEPANGPRAAKVLIYVSGAQIRFRVDGTDPTSTSGMVIDAGSYFEVIGYHDISNFKAIRTGSTDATLDVIYFKEVEY